MRNKLLVVKGFETDIEVLWNVTKLLKEVQGIGRQMENNTSFYNEINKAKSNSYKYRQGDEENNGKHLKLQEHCRGHWASRRNVSLDTGLVKHEEENDIKDKITGVAEE